MHRTGLALDPVTQGPGRHSPQRSRAAFLPSNIEAVIPYPGVRAMNIWVFVVAVPAVAATVLAVAACIAASRADDVLEGLEPTTELDEFTPVPLSPTAVQLTAGE